MPHFALFPLAHVVQRILVIAIVLVYGSIAYTKLSPLIDSSRSPSPRLIGGRSKKKY